ncbi:MAG: hypothetical protein WBD40_17175 [Tepidisphaeraceae bacterium]
MRFDVHQGLYGYADGHGLLAASQAVDAKMTRELRSYTDMAFGGISRHYLTCLPVHAMRQQALVRTWPAPESTRPGSVWSHALFVDFVDLGELRDLCGLLTLFRRPSFDKYGRPVLESYRMPLTVSSQGLGSSERSPHAKPWQDRIVLWGAYGPSSEANVISTEDPAELEELLVRVWSQQWPRLRRAFSFRTRYRVSAQHAETFAVQVVQRLERDQECVQLPRALPGWVDQLSADLTDPSPRLRSFLRRFGAESDDGRRDVSVLITIYDALSRWRPARVAASVILAFPGSEQMTALKAALLGPAEARTDVWHATEEDRLQIILEAEPEKALDLAQLRVLPRLQGLWAFAPAAAGRLAVAVYRNGSQLSDELIRESFLNAAGPDQISVVAESLPELVVEAMKDRVDLLGTPEVWTSSPASRDLAADTLRGASPLMRRDVLRRLLAADAMEGAQAVVGQEPGIWWYALDLESGRVEAEPKELVSSAARLKYLLEAAGLGAVGSRVGEPKSKAAVRLLAVTCSPQAGLWRQLGSKQWADAAPDLAAIRTAQARLRAMVVLVAATRLAGTAETRRRLWLASFAPLHTALARDTLHTSDWAALSPLLPNGDSSDRCDRLRRGAAAVILRDRWSASEIREMIRGSHPFERRMLALLQAKPKKSKGWLRDVLGHFIP